MRYKHSKFLKFHNCWKQYSIKFIFGGNSRLKDRINWGDFQSYVDYRFLVINNHHSAHEYFFHYNHGLNWNKWAYFESESSNSLKVYIFGMSKLREIIWYIIHANRMLLKIWPYLTFGWPFVNIALTMHPTHSKLYIFVILITSRVIWYTWTVIWNILKIWRQLDHDDSYWEGAKSSKILSTYFLTFHDFKTINNSFFFFKMALEYFFH